MTLVPTAVVGILFALPLPQRFAAEVEDAYALDVNPAGLAFVPSHEMRLLYGYETTTGRDFSSLGIWGVAKLADFFGVGASYASDFVSGDTRNRSRFGFGLGGPSLSLGAAWVRDDLFDGGEAERWDVGMSLRPFGWLAGGMSVLDAGEQQGDRKYDFSVAIRPIDRLTVSSRFLLRTLQDGSGDQTVDVAGRAEIEIIDGLTLGAGVDDNRRVFTQIGIDFGRISLGAFGSVRSQSQVGGEMVVRSKAIDTIFPSKRVAVVNLVGGLEPEPELVLLRGKMRIHQWGGVLSILDALLDVPNLQGIYARIGSLSVGWAKAQELRAALLRMRASGRRVDCFLLGADDVSYFVASACNKIVISPPTQLHTDGLAISRLYLGEAFDRLGVRFEVTRIGAFKNSPDRFSRKDMSQEERTQLGEYMDDVYADLVGAISSGRALPPSTVESLLNQGTLTATAARDYGLVDEVFYSEDMERYLWGQYKTPVNYFRVGHLLREASPRSWAIPNKLAVVHIDAPITGGKSQALPLGLGRTVGAQTLIQTLRQLRRARNVRAVVLRIDSPGGDAVASDLVAHEIKRLAQVKPVVASLGDIAASGGYYVAAPAHYIWAEPQTLTGSIGIYSVKADASVLLNRLGIGSEVLTRGKLAGEMSPYSPRSPAGTEAAQKSLAAYYGQFVQVVANGRKLSIEAVDKIGQGRVFSGQDALRNGLVDELGGLHEALQYAATAAYRRLEELEIVHFPEPYQPLGDVLGALGSIMGSSRSDASEQALKTLTGWIGIHPVLGSQIPLLLSDRPLALYPSMVTLH